MNCSAIQLNMLNAKGLHASSLCSASAFTYAVLLSSCVMQSSRRRSANLANILHNTSSLCSAFANAHALTASSCVLDFQKRRSTILANALNNASSLCSAAGQLLRAEAAFKAALQSSPTP